MSKGRNGLRTCRAICSWHENEVLFSVHPFDRRPYTLTLFPLNRSTIEIVKVSSVWGPPTVEEETSGVTTTATPEAANLPSTLVTVRYVLRVEDIGTGREWLVFPQYSDFSELHQELLMLWPPIADLPFPTKRPVPRPMAVESPAAAGPGGGEAIVEERGARLEAFLDGAIALLGIYASIDSR